MTDQKLPDAELEVLAALWQHGEATAREIRERLEGSRPLAHTSVVTLLNRLEEKGLVKKRKGEVGKAFLFRAARRPDKTRRRLVGDLLERAFGGDGVALVTSLFETRPPSQEEVEMLQGLLDRVREERKSGKRRRRS